MTNYSTDRTAADNSTYKKLAAQCLNKALCPALRDFVLADSLVLQNPLLRQAPNRYSQW